VGSSVILKITIPLVAAVLIAVAMFGYIRRSTPVMEMEESKQLRTEVIVEEGLEVATFGTGCFWCMEAAFQQTPGVEEATSGYGGGTVDNPTYEQVYTMATDHRESVQVIFDPMKISYSELLDVFWRGVDPTDDGGQFVDRGFAYTTAVFYHNDEQRDQAQASRTQLAASDRFEGAEIVTPIIEFTTFYEAEEYHQDFYLKSPERYGQYESNSGRDEYRDFVWSEIMKEAN
jgi:methionine-S-sulfoxide reductase